MTILTQSLSHYGGDGGDGGDERTQYIWSPWPLSIASIYIRLHRTFGNKQRCRCTILLQSCYNRCYAETTEETETEDTTRGRNIYGANGRRPYGSIYIRLHRTLGNKQRCPCTILLQSCYNRCYAETEETEETRGRNIYGAHGRCP